MIRINLLPAGEEKYIASARVFLLFSAILLLLLFGIVFANSQVLAERERESKERLEEADREIANLKQIIGKINELKEKKTKLQEKINLIIKLQEENIGPVRVFDEVSLKLPSTKIWIGSVALSGTRMTIEGKSLENQEVANFMKQLESSMFFTKVELQRVQKDAAVNKVPVLKYNMTGDVVLTGKQATEATAKPAEAATPAEAAKPADAAKQP
ncbi:MAG TPA: PilN domain-containing protein [bacterium]|nr:PilN domain-containing protein [bacterium]